MSKDIEVGDVVKITAPIGVALKHKGKAGKVVLKGSKLVKVQIKSRSYLFLLDEVTKLPKRKRGKPERSATGATS